MARRSIPAETRTAVLAAVAQEGSRIADIAKQFGLSVPTVYRWVKAANGEAQPVEATVVA